MDEKLALEMIRATEAAAIRSAEWMGRGMKHQADEAAVKAMRNALSTADLRGVVTIGEGEMDEAPMLFVGEILGRGGSPVFDVAVDPLEATTLVANGNTNALSIVAVAPQGTLLHAPDVYMEKIAVGPKAKGRVHLDESVANNVKAVADALGKDVHDVVVAILDRQRHRRMIEEVRAIGAKVKLLFDGDVVPALNTALLQADVDLLLGSGGAPEGVLAAVALKCLGGDMEARLTPSNHVQWERCQEMGIPDPLSLLTLEQLVASEDVLFVATGVTDGQLLSGVRFENGNDIRTHSVIMQARPRMIRFLEAIHEREALTIY